ncbi:DUF2797 domain-containing protein [Streptomyces sp. ODS05-4]|uniref:DUF2797 domain-containing protein n=1 Tax=Streptomyces sp. ODS05-4 TaxID=2944939 RepID=UPI00210BB393|nr:DUF2797 domain-containing protein [Streptomyces sp. ODS05-4]
MGWRSRGVRWGRDGGGPGLVWEGGRVSRLEWGRRVGFRVVGERRCPGARGNACPVAAVVPGRSTGGLCPECARLDRAHSVAADTAAGDPRVFRVYLAWFGPGLVKVGITAEERGGARLLEQGAVAYTWLGRGALMAARRTEELLGTALGVPDRVPYAAKRLARVGLAGEEQRASEVAELYGLAGRVEGWAETLERLPMGVVDHGRVFALEAVRRIDGVVAELVDGGRLAGTLVAAAGPDLHLAADDGRALVLDTRLMTGWELTGAAGEGAATRVGSVTVPVVAVSGEVQGGLF